MSGADLVDVLVVGAGPTGLTLAAQLRAFGIRFRIVDRQSDQVHESRALAVQPRSLEVFTGLGLAETLVERGNPAMRVEMHAGKRTTRLPLFDIGVDDTGFPFLLFVSQAETEAVLNAHLAERGGRVERGVELVDLRQRPDRVVCALRHRDGRHEEVAARFVVGCDGAHSDVRDRAGIDFRGSAYPQTFVLADLHADGLDPDAVHVYLSQPGMLFFFPLGQPALWRLLTMRPTTIDTPAAEDEAPTIEELQAIADAYTAGAVEIRDPVWRTYFRLHRRHASTYQSGQVFLAGDAAHIHSPAGAQGMNTGIQDAWNLGWKLAMVAAGTATPALLDTYQTERQPVGRSVLRFTNRAFRIATSSSPLVGFVRSRLAPRLMALAARSTRARAAGLRAVAQLAITYRDSSLSEEGRPRLGRGPRAGDRLPDAPIRVDGEPSTLHRALAAPRFHVLLVGPAGAWSPPPLANLDDHYHGAVDVHHLCCKPVDGTLEDVDGKAHRRLGLDGPDRSAHYLIRPDGHIAYRAAGQDLAGLLKYLQRWLPGAATGVSAVE